MAKQSIILSATALRQAIDVVIKAVSSNPIIPILENIHFRAENGELTLTTSDLQRIIQKTIPCEGEALFVVVADKLHKLIKTLPDIPLTLEHDDEKFFTRLITPDGKYKLSGDNPNDWIKHPDLGSDSTFQFAMPALELLDGLAYTKDHTSVDELRPAMTGIYFGYTGQHLVIVAVDGHCLVKFTTDKFQKEKIPGHFNFIIHRKAAEFILHCMPSNQVAQEDVQITVGPTHVCFQTEGVTVFTRIIDERYPDYENAIPYQQPLRVEVNASDLRTVLNRVGILANTTTLMASLNFDPEGPLHIAASDIDYDLEGQDIVPVESYQGEAMRIGINFKMMLSLLGKHTGRFAICGSQPNRALTMFCHDERLLLLQMPVMLPTYWEETQKEAQAEPAH